MKILLGILSGAVLALSIVLYQHIRNETELLGNMVQLDGQLTMAHLEHSQMVREKFAQLDELDSLLFLIDRIHGSQIHDIQFAMPQPAPETTWVRHMDWQDEP